MFIKHIHLKNFRCFVDGQFTLDSQFILITGDNGSGKTSLLEALHYSCYLKSFRTYLNKDIISLDKDYFFIQVDYDLERNDVYDQIQIGYSNLDGKVVKFNKKPIVSYKELLKHYSLISMTADDLKLIGGAPSCRRDFLNYSLLLMSPSFIQQLKRYKQILEQRNTLLQQNFFHDNKHFQDQLYIWTKKLWEESRIIQQHRKNLLHNIETLANQLFSEFITHNTVQNAIQITYSNKNKGFGEVTNFESFWTEYKKKNCLNQEIKFKRSLIGCHLDDFSVIYLDKKARIFGSRGQQKLLTFLIKIAQLKHLEINGKRNVLLLDDFLTDFDEKTVMACIAMILSLDLQIFITAPTQKVAAITKHLPYNYCQIDLNNTKDLKK